MAEHSIRILGVDNGVLTEVYLNKDRMMSRCDERRVWDFDVAGAKQACRDYLRSLYDGTHVPYPEGPRFFVTLRPAQNGVTAHKRGERAQVFELPEDAAAFEAWLTALIA